MNKLLSASNYKLLKLFLGVPFLAILFASLLTFLADVALVLFFVPLILVFWFTLYFGWHWSVGVSLYKKLRHPKPLNLIIFKFLLIFMLVYFVISTIDPFLKDVDETTYKILSFFNLVGSISFLYCIGFIAKTINQVEMKEQVEFKDWIGDMVLIILFPIGIYFLQPRINEIFKTENESTTANTASSYCR